MCSSDLGTVEGAGEHDVDTGNEHGGGCEEPGGQRGFAAAQEEEGQKFDSEGFEDEQTEGGSGVLSLWDEDGGAEDIPGKRDEDEIAERGRHAVVELWRQIARWCRHGCSPPLNLRFFQSISRNSRHKARNITVGRVLDRKSTRLNSSH